MIAKKNPDKKILIEIGKCIKFWRKLNGYDQKRFSKALKTACSYVSRLETGHVGISLNRVNKVANILNVSPFTILRGVPRDREQTVLLNMYGDATLNISKSELEKLFCAKIDGKALTREFYMNFLSIIRSGIYTRETRGRQKQVSL